MFSTFITTYRSSSSSSSVPLVKPRVGISARRSRSGDNKNVNLAISSSSDLRIYVLPSFGYRIRGSNELDLWHNVCLILLLWKQISKYNKLVGIYVQKVSSVIVLSDNKQISYFLLLVRDVTLFQVFAYLHTIASALYWQGKVKIKKRFKHPRNLYRDVVN